MPNDATKKIKSAPKTLLWVVLALFGMLIIFAIFSQKNTPTLRVRDVTIDLEIATTSQARSRGLCCRDSLAKNSGMLFIYDKPGDYRYWMKDTRIPLDMYWISSNKTIVHIERSVQPQSYPRSYGTDELSQYVLETNAGFADIHKISVGDKVKF